MNEQEQARLAEARTSKRRAEQRANGRAFNERMQAEDRRRRLADLRIELVEPEAPEDVTVWRDETQAATLDWVDTAVSDAVSSAAGGRPNSLTGRRDSPQGSTSEPAPSSVDRQRVRAYVDRMHSADRRIVLPLLAEFEQAERERDAAWQETEHPFDRSEFEHLERERDEARRGMKAVSRTLAEVARERDEARVNGATLALRVQPLVEAASACVKTWHAHGYTHNHIPDALALSVALAEWEQA